MLKCATKYIVIAVLAAVMSVSCSKNNEVKPDPKPVVELKITDPSATSKTVALYHNLYNIMDKGTLFGAQIPTEYGLDGGVKWYDDGSISSSDTKFITGSHPAVCGWDITNIEVDAPQNIDGEDFDVIRKHIVAAYNRGAVNTISWHCTNPVSGGNAWDGTRAVYSIIPGGDKHEMFKGWLDKVATFFQTLKTPDGDLIPLIFRPWHEHTGSGFWWGKGNASQTEYIALWQFTVTYLRDVKGLHNLIWAYSPDMVHISSRDTYMEYWPGDEWVDILGLDAYDRDGADYGHKCLQLARLCNVIASERGKYFAITETGLENNNPEDSKYYNAKWWTRMLYKVISGERIAFALVWRNGGFASEGSHYFNAFRGCYSEADFRTFAAYDDVLFENDLPNMYSL